MSLRDIAVRVEASPESRIGSIQPILHEIRALLAALVDTGRGGRGDGEGESQVAIPDGVLHISNQSGIRGSKFEIADP